MSNKYVDKCDILTFGSDEHNQWMLRPFSLKQKKTTKNKKKKKKKTECSLLRFCIALLRLK